MTNDLDSEPEIATAALEVHKAICEDSWDGDHEEGTGKCWRATQAAIPAYLAMLPREYAGTIEDGDLLLVDEDGYPFDNQQHTLNTFAGYPNVVVKHRRVTPWVPVEVTS